jgi:hypothetical protein
MVIYNQFKVLIPKSKVSKAKLYEIIEGHAKIIVKSGDEFKLTFKAGRIDPTIEWFLSITEPDNDYELVIENDRIPKTNYHYMTLYFSGRNLLERIESSVERE